MDHVIQTASQVGIHIRSRRQALKLTQADAATSMGLSQKRLSALERNPDRLTMEQLLALASTLQLDIVLREKSDKPKRKPGEW